jgi:hypothetical protein
MVHVYYSALNFRDVMIATGQMTVKGSKRQLNIVRNDTLNEIHIY